MSDCLELLAWLMLHTTRDGKKTSERGAVMVSTVVTTVAFIKSDTPTDISYNLRCTSYLSTLGNIEDIKYKT